MTRVPINTPNTYYKKRSNIFIDLNKLDKRNPSYLESLSSVSFKDVPKPNLPPKSQEKPADIITKTTEQAKLDENLLDYYKNKNIDSIRLVEISKIISMFNQTYESEHLDKHLDNEGINDEIKKFLKKTASKNTFKKPEKTRSQTHLVDEHDNLG